MSWSDTKRIVRGIFILFIAIILGVMAAEKQINSLAEYHDFVQACNIQGNENQSYSLYFLGSHYTILSSESAAECKAFFQKVREQSTSGKLGDLFQESNTWFSVCRQVVITSAYKSKKWLEDKWQEINYELENY